MLLMGTSSGKVLVSPLNRVVKTNCTSDEDTSSPNSDFDFAMDNDCDQGDDGLPWIHDSNSSNIGSPSNLDAIARHGSSHSNPNGSNNASSSNANSNDGLPSEGNSNDSNNASPSRTNSNERSPSDANSYDSNNGPPSHADSDDGSEGDVDTSPVAGRTRRQARVAKTSMSPVAGPIMTRRQTRTKKIKTKKGGASFVQKNFARQTHCLPVGSKYKDTCGPDAVATVLHNMGKQVNVEQIRNDMSPDGTWVSIGEIQEYLKGKSCAGDILTGDHTNDKLRLLSRPEGRYILLFKGAKEDEDKSHYAVFLAESGELCDNTANQRPLQLDKEDRKLLLDPTLLDPKREKLAREKSKEIFLQFFDEASNNLINILSIRRDHEPMDPHSIEYREHTAEQKQVEREAQAKVNRREKQKRKRQRQQLEKQEFESSLAKQKRAKTN